MKWLSIRLRLTLWYFAIFLLAELIFGAGMWLILRENLFDIADLALEGQAADLERFLEVHKDVAAPQLGAEISEDYKIERSEDYLQISDRTVRQPIADGELNGSHHQKLDHGQPRTNAYWHPEKMLADEDDDDPA